MLPQTSSIWQRDSHPTASGKPGTVQACADEAKEADAKHTELAEQLLSGN